MYSEIYYKKLWKFVFFLQLSESTYWNGAAYMRRKRKHIYIFLLRCCFETA